MSARAPTLHNLSFTIHNLQLFSHFPKSLIYDILKSITGSMAEKLGTGLQNPLQQCESAWSLHQLALFDIKIINYQPNVQRENTSYFKWSE
jgi:hypothetical protein